MGPLIPGHALSSRRSPLPLRLAIVAAVLLLASATGWRWARVKPAAASTSPAGTPHAAMASAPAASVATMSSSASASRLATAAASTPALDDRCSVEPRPPIEERSAAAEDDGAVTPAKPAAPRHTAAFVAARERILDRLRNGADDYARAVATWVDVPADADAPAGAEAKAARLRTLADLARTTTDPRLYALAYRACRATPARDGCQALGLRRWIALDPGNATPWVFALEDAVAAGDVSGQEEALFQLAASARADDRYDTPVGPLVAAAGPDGAEPAAAHALAIDAVGLSAAQATYVFTLSRLCRASAPTDANRRQLCIAAARVFSDHSDTTLGRAMGVALEAHLTGDRTRLDRLRATPTDPVFKSLDEPTTCVQIRRNLQVWRRLAQVGEIGLLREHAAASAAAAR